MRRNVWSTPTATTSTPGCRPAKSSATNCCLGYRDTLIYAHDLSLWRVMDLLIDNYCIGDKSHEDSRHPPLLRVAAFSADLSHPLLGRPTNNFISASGGSGSAAATAWTTWWSCTTPKWLRKCIAAIEPRRVPDARRDDRRIASQGRRQGTDAAYGRAAGGLGRLTRIERLGEQPCRPSASATCTFATAAPATTSPTTAAKSGSTSFLKFVEESRGRLLILGDLLDWWQVPVGAAD